MDIGGRMRECRIAARLKQSEAAEKLKVAESTLSGYENGNRKPEPEMLIEMSRLYSVTTDYLLGVDDGDTQSVPILSRRLREARGNSGLTQTEVSKMCGIHYKTLNGYERGVSEPDTRTLMVLSKAYGVTVDWLIGQPTTYEDAKRVYAISELFMGNQTESGAGKYERK